MAVMLSTVFAATPASAQVVAGPRTAGGFTTSATTSPTTVARGAVVSVTVAVTSTSTRQAVVDLEITTATGRIAQRAWEAQSFTAGRQRTFTYAWTVPANEATSVHTVKVGMFATGWSSLLHWNDSATTFTVTASTPTTTTTTTRPPATTTTTRPPATTTTTRPPATTTTTTRPPATTTTTTRPPTTTTTTTVPPSGRFATLPPGSALPTGAQCASRVRPAAEVRADNAAANQTTWSSQSGIEFPLGARADGNFTGTTDEIIQWAACKWGIDEDIVRAQVAKESWWHQNARGDYINDLSACGPTLRGTNPCPESVGLMQVRYLYHTPAFDGSLVSSAYNIDYAYAAWRNCYEGNATWLNQFERGRDYAKGDAWGCVGLWFSGRWYTEPATTYMAGVQDYLNQRVWESASFKNG